MLTHRCVYQTCRTTGDLRDNFVIPTTVCTNSGWYALAISAAIRLAHLGTMFAYHSGEHVAADRLGEKTMRPMPDFILASAEGSDQMTLQECDAVDVLAAKYFRVTRRRENGMVEFDFAIGEPELFAELVLPQAAFEEFCRINSVVDMAEHPSMHADHGARLSQVRLGQKG